MSAGDFADASAAADNALEAAMLAHDVFLVVSLALSTQGGHLSVNSQEALWSVAQMGVDKAREARTAIDRAGGLFRTSGARR